MDTFEAEMFIHKPQYGDGYEVYSSDMTDAGCILLGSQTITLNIPDTDPVQAEVDMLEKKVTSVKAKAQSEVTQLEERIQELKCLEFKDGQ